MIRRLTLRHNGIRSHSLQARPCKGNKGASCSTAVPPLSSAAISTENVAAAPAAPAGTPALDASRVVVPRRSEWRPSEAHKTSATSVARKEVQGAQLKAGAAPRARVAARAVATDGTDKARSPGLRRRELLGGAEDVQSQVQAQLAAASAAPLPETAATTKAAAAAVAGAGGGGVGPPPSVVSLSATTRFRARRELQRLAAAGNAEAIEALRVSGSLSSPSFASSSEPDGASGGGGGGGGPVEGSGGGFTPLTVLPVLLALVGAGYCVVNDLAPREWLWRIGGGGGGGGGAAGPGDSAGAEGRDAQGKEQEGEEDASSLSPLLRTLSRVAAFVPVGSSPSPSSSPSSSLSSSSSADPTAPAPAHDGGEAGSPAGSVSGSPAASGVGQGSGGGWALWGWRRRHDGDAVAEESERNDDIVAVLAEPARERSGHIEEAEAEGLGREQDGAGKMQVQQQQQPRWLRRAS